MSRVAALTGATGFLGRHVIRALADRGWAVRALVRRAPDLPELADIPIELVLGDLGDAAALRRLTAGAGAVIHAAGAVKAPTRAAFFRANADGAGNVAAAWAEAAPGARLILVSSMAAREPALSHYAASKRAGEARVAEVAAGLPNGGDWLAVRPGAIYGAHDEETLKVLKLASGRIQFMLNAPDALVTLIDARDAAAAIAALTDAPIVEAPAGEAPTGEAARIRAPLELVDARTGGYTWRELAETAARVLGRTPKPARIPEAALRMVARAGDVGAALFGKAEMLTTPKAREILHPDWSSSPERQPSPDLWRPRIGLEEGLGAMADWARGAGRL